MSCAFQWPFLHFVITDKGDNGAYNQSVITGIYCTPDSLIPGQQNTIHHKAKEQRSESKTKIKYQWKGEKKEGILVSIIIFNYLFIWRMESSGMLRRVALVRTDVSEELSASIIRVVFLRSVRRLLVTANVIASSPILVTLMMEALSSSKTSVRTRVTWRNIPEDAILHSPRHENFKSYTALTGWTL
jgi:hypothetical protein